MKSKIINQRYFSNQPLLQCYYPYSQFALDVDGGDGASLADAQSAVTLTISPYLEIIFLSEPHESSGSRLKMSLAEMISSSNL